MRLLRLRILTDPLDGIDKLSSLILIKKNKVYILRILPNYFYSVNVNVQEKKLIHIIMIDTDKLCGNADHPDNFDLNLKGPAKELSDYYFNQIEDELKKVSKEKIPFVIIAGHYPLWSISFHGPTYLLVNKLRPLLFKYKVNVYFYGEHVLVD